MGEALQLVRPAAAGNVELGLLAARIERLPRIGQLLIESTECCAIGRGCGLLLAARIERLPRIGQLLRESTECCAIGRGCGLRGGLGALR